MAVQDGGGPVCVCPVWGWRGPRGCHAQLPGRAAGAGEGWVRGRVEGRWAVSGALEQGFSAGLSGSGHEEEAGEAASRPVGLDHRVQLGPSPPCPAPGLYLSWPPLNGRLDSRSAMPEANGLFLPTPLPVLLNGFLTFLAACRPACMPPPCRVSPRLAWRWYAPGPRPALTAARCLPPAVWR